MIAAIIGAGSMLGTELGLQLRAVGAEVLRAGRSPDCDIVLDLDDPRLVLPDGLPTADVVFHCGSAFADDSLEGRRANGMTNALGCFNVLELMRRLQCDTCIYAGSVSSQSGLEVLGRSGYGLSKALGEQVLAWGLTEGRRGGRFCSIRFPQLYDVAGRCCRHQAWFGRIVAYASRGRDLNMPASGGARNFMHVRDAARLMIGAHRGDLSGAWSACHPESLNYHQIAQHAYEVFGAGGRVTIDPAKTPFRGVSFPSGKALFGRLGIWPEIGMREGLGMIRDAGCADAFGPMDVT